MHFILGLPMPNGPSRASWGAFFRNFVATLVAAGTLCVIIWTWVGPSVTAWAQRELGTAYMAEALGKIEATQAKQAETQQQQADTQKQQQQTIATISDTQSRTAQTLNAVVERIASLEETSRDSRIAPVRFMEEGNSISNGAIGGFVQFHFRYVKSRDCGRPISVAYFRNGGGIVHAFEASSTTAEDGRGSSGPVSSEVQSARFIARIPSEEGVQPTPEGYAMGWVLLSWPNCPNVPEVRSPQVPFQIFAPT
ncbi:hypothetical protein QCN27_17735 [Cereibacter sp. SYSU M97828]|nr:hypothetical protein [Cereibacter flavus]